MRTLASVAAGPLIQHKRRASTHAVDLPKNAKGGARYSNDGCVRTISYMDLLTVEPYSLRPPPRTGYVCEHKADIVAPNTTTVGNPRVCLSTRQVGSSD